MKSPSFVLKYCFMATLPLFLISGCSNTEDEARFQIYDLTNIEIPDEATFVYNYNNDVFVGRVSRYSVFSFEERPVHFLV